MSHFLSLPPGIIEDILVLSESLVKWTLVSKALRQLVFSSTRLKSTWLLYAYLDSRSKFPADRLCWLERKMDPVEVSTNRPLVEEIMEGGDSELSLLYWRQYMSDYSFEEDLTTYGRWLKADEYHNHWFISHFCKRIPRYREFLSPEMVEFSTRQYRIKFDEIFDSLLLTSIRNNNSDVLRSLVLHSPDPYVMKRLPLAYAIGEGAKDVTLLMLNEFGVRFTMCHAIACVKEDNLEALEWMIRRSSRPSDIWDGNYCGFMRALGISLSQGSHEAIQLILDTLLCSNSRTSFDLNNWEMYPKVQQALRPEPWKSILKQICLCSRDIQTFQFALTLCAKLSRVSKEIWREEALLLGSIFYPHHFTHKLMGHLLSTGVDPNTSDGLAVWNVGFNFTNGGYSEYEMRTYGAIPIDLQEVDRKMYIELAKCLISSGLRITSTLLGQFVSAGHLNFLQTLLKEHQLPLMNHSKSLLGVALDASILSEAMVRFLLENGVDAEPSHFLLSVSKGQLDVVKLVYDQTQPIDEPILAQALEIAVKYMHLEVVKFLLEQGATIENLLHGFCVNYLADGSNVETQCTVRFERNCVCADLGDGDWSLNKSQDRVFLQMLKSLGSAWARTQGIPKVPTRISTKSKSIKHISEAS